MKVSLLSRYSGRFLELAASLVVGAALAVTIIGGQSLCLFLTLLLVPVAYVKFDALEQALVGDGAKRWLREVNAATFGRLRPANRTTM